MNKHIYKIFITMIFLGSSCLTFGQFPPIDTYFFPQDSFVEVETWSFEKNDKTKLFTDSILINLRKYNKVHNLIEYRSYLSSDKNNFDQKKFDYDKYNNLTNIQYIFGERGNYCAFRQGMQPFKKIEIGNEKGQLTEMTIVSHYQDSLSYKFYYDKNELLSHITETQYNEIERIYKLKYNIYK